MLIYPSTVGLMIVLGAPVMGFVLWFTKKLSVKYANDKKQNKLTATSMFLIVAGMLLCVVLLLITYGIIFVVVF